MHEGHDTHDGAGLSEEQLGEPNCPLMRDETRDNFELSFGAYTG
jgi:hypothetical protein